MKEYEDLNNEASTNEKIADTLNDDPLLKPNSAEDSLKLTKPNIINPMETCEPPKQSSTESVFKATSTKTSDGGMVWQNKNIPNNNSTQSFHFNPMNQNYDDDPQKTAQNQNQNMDFRFAPVDPCLNQQLFVNQPNALLNHNYNSNIIKSDKNLKNLKNDIKSNNNNMTIIDPYTNITAPSSLYTYPNSNSNPNYNVISNNNANNGNHDNSNSADYNENQTNKTSTNYNNNNADFTGNHDNNNSANYNNNNADFNGIQTNNNSSINYNRASTSNNNNRINYNNNNSTNFNESQANSSNANFNNNSTNFNESQANNNSTNYNNNNTTFNESQTNNSSANYNNNSTNFSGIPNNNSNANFNGIPNNSSTNFNGIPINSNISANFNNNNSTNFNGIPNNSSSTNFNGIPNNNSSNTNYSLLSTNNSNINYNQYPPIKYPSLYSNNSGYIQGVNQPLIPFQNQTRLVSSNHSNNSQFQPNNDLNSMTTTNNSQFQPNHGLNTTTNSQFQPNNEINSINTTNNSQFQPNHDLNTMTTTSNNQFQPNNELNSIKTMTTSSNSQFQPNHDLNSINTTTNSQFQPNHDLNSINTTNNSQFQPNHDLNSIKTMTTTNNSQFQPNHDLNSINTNNDLNTMNSINDNNSKVNVDNFNGAVNAPLNYHPANFNRYNNAMQTLETSDYTKFPQGMNNSASDYTRLTQGGNNNSNYTRLPQGMNNNYNRLTQVGNNSASDYSRLPHGMNNDYNKFPQGMNSSTFNCINAFKDGVCKCNGCTNKNDCGHCTVCSTMHKFGGPFVKTSKKCLRRRCVYIQANTKPTSTYNSAYNSPYNSNMNSTYNSNMNANLNSAYNSNVNMNANLNYNMNYNANALNGQIKTNGIAQSGNLPNNQFHGNRFDPTLPRLQNVAQIYNQTKNYEANRNWNNPPQNFNVNGINNVNGVYDVNKLNRKRKEQDNEGAIQMPMNNCKQGGYAGDKVVAVAPKNNLIPVKHALCCHAMGCNKFAMFKSKYCSSACGVKTNLSRLQVKLTKQLASNDIMEYSSHKGDIEKLRKLQLKLEYIQQEINSLKENRLKLCEYIEARPDCSTDNNQITPNDAVANCDGLYMCPCCQNYIGVSQVCKHVVACYNKVEKIYSYVSPSPSNEEFICDKQLKKPDGFCKRLSSNCVDHKNLEKFKDNVICGFFLEKDTDKHVRITPNSDDLYKDVCGTNRNKCVIHFGWERSRLASTEQCLQNLCQTRTKIQDYLSNIHTRMKNRFSVISMFLHKSSD